MSPFPQNPVLKDQIWKKYIKDHDEESAKNWAITYGFVIDEYSKLYKELQNFSNKLSSNDEQLILERVTDNRSVKPLPETVNQEYGWIANRDGFSLSKYGPDYDGGLPLPEIYRIIY